MALGRLVECSSRAPDRLRSRNTSRMRLWGDRLELLGPNGSGDQVGFLNRFPPIKNSSKEYINFLIEKFGLRFTSDFATADIAFPEEVRHARLAGHRDQAPKT